MKHTMGHPLTVHEPPDDLHFCCLHLLMLQMYLNAASRRIWELRGGALVHIQEGAFMPPRTPDTVLPEATGTSAAAAPGTAAVPAGSIGAPAAAPAPHEVGLGEEAREFIMQQLPLFQVTTGTNSLHSALLAAASHTAAIQLTQTRQLSMFQ
jgi:hypothetical protein